MSRVISRVILTAAVMGLTVVASFAQQQSTTSETKTFEVLAVQGNDLVVRLPEGTRELTVPADFRFMQRLHSVSTEAHRQSRCQGSLPRLHRWSTADGEPSRGSGYVHAVQPLQLLVIFRGRDRARRSSALQAMYTRTGLPSPPRTSDSVKS